jgi:4-aminobutyrate--pyruvate transaminase
MIITTAQVDELLKRFAATLEDVSAWVTAGMPDA